MDNQMIRNLKVVGILVLAMALVVFVIYLIYGFTLLWQAMAAGIITGFLLLVVLILIGTSIYLWIKNLLIKRELKKIQTDLDICRLELIKLKENSKDHQK